MLELVIEAPHHRPVIPCAELLVKKLLSQESERPTICDVDKLQQLHRGQVSPFTLRTLQHVVGHMARFVGHRRSPSSVLKRNGLATDHGQELQKECRRERRPCTTHELAMHLMASRNMNRSEEHTSELQSQMRISYAVFCLKKKKS